tara:strand:- start:158727 stop:159065 length:339 start_codon:yes stop_codon:yes gene_type:complete
VNRPLLWKFFLIIAAGSVALFWLVSLLTLRTEQAMSLIADEHQETLLAYGETAEALYEAGDTRALENWLADLQAREDTWAADQLQYRDLCAESRLKHASAIQSANIADLEEL